MTTPIEPRIPEEPSSARRSLIDEARRHQRRRRRIIGAAMVTPIVIGGLIALPHLGGAGSTSGKVAAPSRPPRSEWPAPEADHGNPPSAGSPSNVVVLSPITGDVIAVSPSAASAAALQAVRSAVAAEMAQAQKAAESAAQADAARAAAQSGHQ